MDSIDSTPVPLVNDTATTQPANNRMATIIIPKNLSKVLILMLFIFYHPFLNILDVKYFSFLYLYPYILIIIKIYEVYMKKISQIGKFLET